MRGFRGSRIDQDRRDAAFDRAVEKATAQNRTTYWIVVRFAPNAEPKKLTYYSATERALAVIGLGLSAEVIGQGEGVDDGKA